MDRRSFISSGISLGTLAAGVLVSGKLASALGADAKGVPGATVATTAGKVRGLSQGGVQAFRGVPYAASTAGANRFMPPVKRQPWTNVREAYELGLRCPQRLSDFHGAVAKEWEVMCLDEPMGEDCLNLNVWTPSVGGGHKRPVMVWLHGGGYTSGSGGFIPYSGQELARKHDVVVVTVNHRLTVFGFMYLAGVGGEKFARSSNIGMLDIVASLEWVRDNIAAFGGDPGCVTIFGQSGGGGKVSVLMAMPPAKGLFHRAIVQSGAALKGASKDVASKSTGEYLAKLGLKPDQADQLQTLTTDQLLAGIIGGPFPAAGQVLEPVVDGTTLPTDPFDPVAPAISADIPLLIGTTETEVSFFPGQQLDPIDDTDLHTRIKRTLRGADDAKVNKVIAAYRKGRPTATNTDLYLIISSDATFRVGVVLEAERKAAQAKAPVYQYYFTWRSPVHDGKMRSFHALEIPFVFDDVDISAPMTGSGPDAQVLAGKVSSAWVAFARTGNPSHKGLPNWKPFDNTQRATMILDNECKLVNDPYGEEQRLLHSA